MTDLESLKSQYETAKQQFRTAMIQYETEQTDEAREIFEERQAQMRGIFDELQTLSMNTMTKQASTDREIHKQLDANQQTVQAYHHLESTASSTLDSMLAAYPMYEEIIFRNRLLYAHIAFLLAGVVGVLVFMVIHSRTKPNTSPTNVNKAVQKIQKNATNELNKTKNIVQKQTKEYGKQALGIADKAVVQGKKQTGKVYNQALNFMFGEAK